MELVDKEAAAGQELVFAHEAWPGGTAYISLKALAPFEAQDSADLAEEFWGKDKGTSWLSPWFPHTLQRCFGYDLVGGPVVTCGHPCQAPWNHECQNSCAKCRGHNDTCICGGVVRYYPDVTVACGVWEMNDRGQMRAQQQGGRTNHIVCAICGAEGTVKECAGCYLRICQNCTCSLPHVCPYCQDCCDYFEDRRPSFRNISHEVDWANPIGALAEFPVDGEQHQILSRLLDTL